jgi:Protein of unknown function (DUF998)
MLGDRDLLLLTLATAGYLSAASALFAVRLPGYRHARNMISEIGAYGAPGAQLAAWGAFLPVGLALAVVGVFARDAHAAQLALCMAIGYGAAALFPCDPGAPLLGSSRQLLHSAGAGVEYAGGAWALVLLGEHGGPVFLLAAATVACGALAASLPALGSLRGALQRLVELTLFAALALALAHSSAAR